MEENNRKKKAERKGGRKGTHDIKMFSLGPHPGGRV